MGSSKTYRGGPGWEAKNTTGGQPQVSRGAIVKTKTPAMSSGKTMRAGEKAGPKSKGFSGPQLPKGRSFGGAK